MSNNVQTPSTVRRSLIIVIAAIVVGTVWFVFQAKDNTNKTLDDTKKAQATEQPKQTDEYKGWKSYTWVAGGVSFKYPGDWSVQEDAKLNRVYARNSEVDLLKEETPANFQQIWLSADASEASRAREDNIKKGLSEYRVVSGDVKASTIKASDVTINIYEYETAGGPTLEAYWTNKAGARLYATNSTEVGQQNQTDMVANLKKILASLAFTE